MEKYICISRNLFFKHHQKIEIGKIYKGRYNKKFNSVSIYDNSEDFIGFYNSENFELVDIMRDKKLNAILD